MKLLYPFAPALLPLLIIACASEPTPPTDPFGAYNALGGARRNNDYSRYTSTSITSLGAVELGSLKGGMLAPPLPGPSDRMVLLLQGDQLATMRYDSILWTRQLSGPLFRGIAIDSSGLIYAVSTKGLLQAVGPDGTPAWKVSLAGEGGDSSAIINYSFPLALNGGVVVGSTAGTVECMSVTGKPLWISRRGAAVGQLIAADPATGVAFAVTHNDYGLSDSVVTLDLAGAERWSRPVEGARVVYGPVIVGDLIVVGAARQEPDGNRTPLAIAFTREGKEAWRSTLVVMPRGIAGDDVGNIYISGSGVRSDFAGGALLSFDRTGKKRWMVALESDIPASPVVSSNWLYFVSLQDGRVGLFSYTHDGVFGAFVPVTLTPEVLPQPVITPFGQVVLAGAGESVLVR
jgi:outer membrane protein assembly factor BamB